MINYLIKYMMLFELIPCKLKNIYIMRRYHSQKRKKIFEGYPSEHLRKENKKKFWKLWSVIEKKSVVTDNPKQIVPFSLIQSKNYK